MRKDKFWKLCSAGEHRTIVLSGPAAIAWGMDPREFQIITESPDGRHVHLWTALRPGDPPSDMLARVDYRDIVAVV